MWICFNLILNLRLNSNTLMAKSKRKKNCMKEPRIVRCNRRKKNIGGKRLEINGELLGALDGKRAKIWVFWHDWGGCGGRENKVNLFILNFNTIKWTWVIMLWRLQCCCFYREKMSVEEKRREEERERERVKTSFPINETASLTCTNFVVDKIY